MEVLELFAFGHGLAQPLRGKVPCAGSVWDNAAE
jgi:hypothetical protein